MGIGKFHHPPQLASFKETLKPPKHQRGIYGTSGPIADAGQSPASHRGVGPLPTLIPQHALEGGSPQDSAGALLVDLLCFLLDLGLITILQILTGFPES